MAHRIILGSVLVSMAACAAAQSSTVDPAAGRGIDAGNQAWIAGMKSGNAAMVAASYAGNAIDCAADGDCITGRSAIEAHFKDRSTKLGHAASASVTSDGSVQQGDFVYEWGRAEASFAGGAKIAGRYLTVWQRQADGSWKIFRNMAIPAGSGSR